MKNYAFIYCPRKHVFASTRKRWQRIASLLDTYGIPYDMVQSESPASVERLFNMLLANGYEDIIVVGGDSAINAAVNCLMRAEKHTRERVRLGVIPNGTMNDFASFWGLYYDDLDLAVRSLSEHRVRKVDVGQLTYTNRVGETETRYFINCVNIGLMAVIQRLRQQTYRWLWSRKVSFLITGCLLPFMKKFFRVNYSINFVDEEHRISTMCIGNALGYGQTPNAVPYNGLLDITVVRHSPMSEVFGAMYLWARGQILNHNRIQPYRSRQVEVRLSKGAPVSVDGHPILVRDTFTAQVLMEEVNFIIEAKPERVKN